MSVVEQATEHGADRGRIPQQFAPVFHRTIRGQHGTGAFGRTAIPAAFRYWLAVSRRMRVTCWMRRSGHPSRPRAKTCCFFSSFKTLLMPRRLQAPAGVNVPGLFSLAAFQVITIGRFWVIAEVQVA